MSARRKERREQATTVKNRQAHRERLEAAQRDLDALADEIGPDASTDALGEAIERIKVAINEMGGEG